MTIRTNNRLRVYAIVAFRLAAGCDCLTTDLYQIKFPSRSSCPLCTDVVLLIADHLLKGRTHKLLVTKFLTSGLTCKLYNPLDDWLQSTGPTNHSADYKIHGLTEELKRW